MYPYVLKLTFGNKQVINDASNIQTQRQPHQSSMDSNDILQGFVRPSLAEFFGSLLFVLLSALLGFSTVNSQLSTSIYEGAIVFLLMSMLARISGGHFNPAITISVLLCGQCRITLGICIVFMQLFGSFIGAMLVRTLILEAAYIDIFRGSILDESNATLVNRIQAFLLEMLLSFLISSTYLFTSIDTKGNNGIFCSAAVSIARSLVSFIGYRPLGQCANVARSVATSAAASVFFFDAEPWRVLYIYFFANVIGAILASLAYWISRPQSFECIRTDGCKDGIRESRTE